MSEAIQHGPFKGLGPTAGEITVLKDRNGVPVIRDGAEVKNWGLSHRTRHFLEIYPPHEGWSVIIESTPGPFNLPDPDTWVKNSSNGNEEMAVQPTVTFTATLRDKEGRIMASASTLRVMNGISAWEQGESKARGRLYDAVGLTTTALTDEPDDGDTRDRAKPETKTTSNSSVVHVGFKGPRLDEPAPKGDEASPNDEATQLQGNPAGSQDDGQMQPDSAVQNDLAQAESLSPDQPSQDAKPISAVKQIDSSPTKTDVNPVMLRQVMSRAKILGVAVPAFKSNAELQAFSRTLLKGKAGAQ